MLFCDAVLCLSLAKLHDDVLPQERKRNETDFQRISCGRETVSFRSPASVKAKSPASFPNYTSESLKERTRRVRVATMSQIENRAHQTQLADEDSNILHLSLFL